MKVAIYVGRHRGDGMLTQAGWAITRAAQRGAYAQSTHVEAIHAEHADGSVTIASASLRDGGVRAKRTRLAALDWRIVEVPGWPVRASVELLATTAGQRYDLRGAVATVLPFREHPSRWFCNEWVGAPYLPTPWSFTPAQFTAVALSQGRDITVEFFNARQHPEEQRAE